MTPDEYSEYHKYHRMTMSYGEALKYMNVGWKLKSLDKVLLKGLDKWYEQCVLVWELDDNPIIPPGLS